ncbi:MAG: hypothetical protein M1503_06830 [Thaumarchaeota archaeon]|nr:hypothetical protein [Nitrososphaerota archaeon]MCL5317957.1 hypothetical protein [Nitrososphaerota archaeon]
MLNMRLNAVREQGASLISGKKHTIAVHSTEEKAAEADSRAAEKIVISNQEEK